MDRRCTPDRSIGANSRVVCLREGDLAEWKTSSSGRVRAVTPPSQGTIVNSLTSSIFLQN